MFSDLGERKKNYYRRMVEYPTDRAKKEFVKEVSKGYNLTSEEDKLINLHKFKMDIKHLTNKKGSFRDYYASAKTYIITKLNPEIVGKSLVEKFGTATKVEEIKYRDNNISVFEKGGVK